MSTPGEGQREAHLRRVIYEIGVVLDVGGRGSDRLTREQVIMLEKWRATLRASVTEPASEGMRVVHSGGSGEVVSPAVTEDVRRRALDLVERERLSAKGGEANDAVREAIPGAEVAAGASASAGAPVRAGADVEGPSEPAKREIEAFRAHLEEISLPVQIATRAVVNRAREVAAKVTKGQKADRDDYTTLFSCGPLYRLAMAVEELARQEDKLRGREPYRGALATKPVRPEWLARRAFIPDWSPAELAIREVVRLVEEMGADERLTKAVILLGDAQAWVADWIDGVKIEDHYPRPATQEAPSAPAEPLEAGVQALLEQISQAFSYAIREADKRGDGSMRRVELVVWPLVRKLAALSVSTSEKPEPVAYVSDNDLAALKLMRDNNDWGWVPAFPVPHPSHSARDGSFPLTPLYRAPSGSVSTSAPKETSGPPNRWAKVAAFDPADRYDSGVRLVVPEGRLTCPACESNLRLNVTDDGRGYVWGICADPLATPEPAEPREEGR